MTSLQEVPGGVKSIETERKGGCQGLGAGSECSLGTEFQLGKMGSSGGGGGDNCTTLQVCLGPLSVHLTIVKTVNSMCGILSPSQEPWPSPHRGPDRGAVLTLQVRRLRPTQV